MGGSNASYWSLNRFYPGYSDSYFMAKVNCFNSKDVARKEYVETIDKGIIVDLILSYTHP